MSREVRRVPVGWKHPVEHNPHWEFQASTPWGRSQPASKLHGPTERFVSLYGESVTPAHEDWERERAEWEAGQHEHLLFLMHYYSAEGYLNPDGTRDQPRLYTVYADDGETVIREFHPVTVEDLLAVYPYSGYATEPTPERYMPDFGIPEDELGWCLYETVSEGSPVTPVFATAEELIEHLSTIGQDWGQVPMRRAAAEALVGAGHSMGSMLVAGGKVYKSDTDADLIAALPKDGAK